MSTNSNIYFLYSKEQQDLRYNTELKMGRYYYPGEVIVNGKKRKYTQISNTTNIRFKDVIVVATVTNLKSIRYTEPKIIKK